MGCLTTGWKQKCKRDKHANILKTTPSCPDAAVTSVGVWEGRVAGLWDASGRRKTSPGKGRPSGTRARAPVHHLEGDAGKRPKQNADPQGESPSNGYAPELPADLSVGSFLLITKETHVSFETFSSC